MTITGINGRRDWKDEFKKPGFARLFGYYFGYYIFTLPAFRNARRYRRWRVRRIGVGPIESQALGYRPRRTIFTLPRIPFKRLLTTSPSHSSWSSKVEQEYEQFCSMATSTNFPRARRYRINDFQCPCPQSSFLQDFAYVVQIAFNRPDARVRLNTSAASQLYLIPAFIARRYKNLETNTFF